MTLKQLRIAALTATFLTGTVALGYAQSSSTIGTGGSSAETMGLSVQRAAVMLLHGREPNSAVTEHHGGDAVP